VIQGKATVSDTYDYFQNKPIQPVNFRSTGWYVSQGGMGTYRMSAQNPEHRNALLEALQNGFNVIDTAINYMDTLSEKLVGEILQQAISEKIVGRGQIVLISKAGYIQGTLLEKLKNLEQQGKGYQDVAKLNDQLWYSLDPQFVADMVDLSRKRMQVETIDIYLLHNPEYLLQYELQKKGDQFDPAMDDFLFYQKIKKAFVILEKKVKEGAIQFYGVSSNTLPTPPEFPEHVNALKLLAVALEAAEEVWGKGENHHFAFLQFPLNLIEFQGYLLELDEYPEGPMTLFEFCKRHRLDILTNRPLNAIWKNALYRFVTYDLENETDYFYKVQQELEKMLEVEQQFLKFCEQHSLDQLPVGEQKLKDFFIVYQYVKQYMHDIQDLDQYYQFVYGFLANRIRYARDIFEKALVPEHLKEGMELYNRFANRFQLLGDLLKFWILQRMNERIAPLEHEINRFVGTSRKSWPLPNKVFLILKSIEEPFVILNGMRKSSYVKEFLKSLRSKTIDVTKEDYRTLHKRLVKKITSTRV
jgi:hypothetical protein